MLQWLLDLLSWTGGGPWFYGYVVFSLVMHALEQYLNVRQYWKNCETEVPADVLDINSKNRNYSYCKSCGKQYKRPTTKKKENEEKEGNGESKTEASKEGNGVSNSENKDEDKKEDNGKSKDEEEKEDEWIEPMMKCTCGAEVSCGRKPEVFAQNFREAQAYAKDKRSFGFYKENINFCWALFGLITGPALAKFAWNYFDSTDDYREYKATLFLMFLQGWLDKPLGIALGLYSDFVVEERHGFNKKTLKLFFMDLVKSEILTYFFGGLLIPLLIWTVKSTGEMFYLYLWALVQVLIFVMMWIYPNFIQPMFNKFEKLKDEELRMKIEELAGKHKFPLTKLYQIDGSKRSSHSNAYFFGFWKWKQIVLYDTLLHLGHDDILAILCHELGHWKFNHINFNLVISSVHIFVLFRLFGLVMYAEELSKGLIQEFGYGDLQLVMISLSIFSMLFEPTERLVQLLMTMLSRKFEFQADGFAVTNGMSEALASGLIQISDENKGDLNHDPWYSWYHFSHPPMVDRLRALKDQQSNGDSKKTQ